MIRLMRLDDTCELITDGTHYTPPDSGVGVPFLTVKDVSHDGKLDLFGCSKISNEEYTRALAGNSAPQKGDVLFSKDGTVGKVSVITGNDEFAVLSSLAILRPNSEVLDPSYLGHVLKSESVIDQATRSKTGSAIRRIILKDLKRVEFYVPPLPEQRRIAAILDKADELRQKRRQAIEKLDQLLQSVFLDMFGDPVTNPKGWDQLPLGDVTKFENGDRSSNYPSGPDIVSHGVLFLSTKNIRSSMLDLSECQYITAEKFKSLSRGKLQAGDLIITLRGTLGSCALFDEAQYDTGFINAQMMIIRSSAKLLPRFLHSLLVSSKMQSYIRYDASGAAVPQLTANGLKKIRVIVPPLYEQQKYCDVLEQFNQQMFCAKAAFSKLESLFGSLQQRAFNGTL